MTSCTVEGRQVPSLGGQALMRNGRMAGDAFFRAPGNVMNSVAFYAYQFFFGMGAGSIHFCSVAVAGGTIGFFQFVGMGQVLRIAMANRAVNFAVVGLPVFVMTVKALVRAE